MEGVGQSFSLPFRSRGWFGTAALMGLITLIPIFGQICLLGWMLTLLDHYRQGRTDLPPAGFQYFGRGLNVAVVFLVYVLILAAILVLPLVLLGVLAAGTSATSSSEASNGLGAAFGGAITLLYLAIFVVAVAFYLFYPAIILATERYGIGGGLNPGHVWAIASRDWKNTLIAALLTYAALFIGGLGIYACCVGYIVTLPLGYAIMAGILRYYEATFEPLSPPPIPPAVAPA